MQNTSFRSYLRRSFLRPMILFLLSTYLLLVLALLALFFFSTIQISHKENRSLSLQLEVKIQQVLYTAQKIANDKQLQAAVARKSTTIAVNEFIYKQINALELPSIFVFFTDENVLLSNLSPMDLESFLKSELMRMLPYANFPLQEKSNLQFSQQSIAYEYIYQVSKDAYFYIGIPHKVLEEQLANTKSDILCLVDAYQNILYTGQPQLYTTLGKMVQDFPKNGIYSLGNGRYYVSQSYLLNNSLRLLHFYSLLLYETLLFYASILIPLLALGMSFIAYWVSDKLAQKSLKPIQVIVDTIQSQDLSLRIQKNTFTEFQPLYQEFNQMLNRIEQLLQNNAQLHEHKRLLELKQLKARFNPHFVFNILESIRFVMYSDLNKAGDMLVSFGNILRYQIDNTQSKVSLKEDLDYVAQYLHLQKLRYSEELKYKIQLAPSLEDLHIPKLLIQPLVENAIKHGYRQGHTLEILVEVENTGKSVWIKVWDNGRGFPEEFNWEEICQADSPHIGLYNTHRFIQLSYGEGFGLHIQSGKRTCVSIELAKEENHV